MPWWMVPFVATVFVCFAYAMVLWILALGDLGSYTDAVWKASGHSKTAWVAALFVVPFLSGVAYWSGVRPHLDMYAPANLQRPIPAIARLRPWESHIREWDEGMQRKPWFPWAVGLVVAFGVASLVGVRLLG